MINNKEKDIARWAVEYALKNGCSAARVAILKSDSNSFEYRDKQLDRLHQSSENKLYIELFTDGRYGSFSTNRLEKNELQYFIKEGILSTQFLAQDLCRQLPDPKRYYKSAGEDLDLYDNSFYNIDTQNKIELARQTVDEVYGKRADIISVTASYGDACSDEYMVASNGFEGENRDTAFSITAEVTLKTEGDARPESYWYDSSVYWNDLIKKGIASEALNRVLRKVGQIKIQSGKYNMLLDNSVSSRLLSPMLSALRGNALHQKNSFLINKIGQKITSDKFTLIDSPHMHRSFGARWFDGEGVATSDRTIIENGILKFYYIDTYSSLKLNMLPTVTSPSILVANTGSSNFDSLLKSMDKGIWVTGFNGGNCNPTTGDFSFGVEGIYVEKGECTQPIGEMNITGNILELWANLIETGNDPRNNSAARIPSLLFGDVNFSGL
ncbi:TldD/PmbA family protein [Dysgonomonas sp. 216]|uniref:TldD/PmbA family protein n=1 Tax=Dysgonomonas sp. 216 TaxID=2302934 RepID=UPI0013D08B03|nr:TldD/PmbA family protein [Dysgonomonas sp. 216]NDW18005.1 TldD/PmbA family protein [Dysgonomonas sp. 216]